MQSMENDELTVDKTKFEEAQKDGRGEKIFNQTGLILRNSNVLDMVLTHAFTSSAATDLDIDVNELKKMIDKSKNGEKIDLTISANELIHFACSVFRFGYWAGLMSVKYGELDINKIGE